MNGRIQVSPASIIERELLDAQERCTYWKNLECTLTASEMELRDLAFRDVERLEKTLFRSTLRK